MGAPAVVEHFTGAERAARGRAARAEVPARATPFESIPDRDPWACSRSRRPRACPSSCRSATAACSSRRSRSTAAPRRSWRTISRHAARGLAGAALRRRAPRQLRRLRVAGAALVFDLNDFDETLPGPFEWDVKRLAASFEIAGRDRGFPDAERRTAVVERPYARTARRCGASRRWRTSRSGTRGSTSSGDRSECGRRARRSRSKRDRGSGREGADEGQHEGVREADPGGRRRAADRLRPAADRADPRARRARDRPRHRGRRSASSSAATAARSSTIAATCSRVPLRRHRPQGRRRRQRRHALLDLLLLSAGRRATRSSSRSRRRRRRCSSRTSARASSRNHGQRVVEGQRLMQAASDIFLGWVHDRHGLDGARATSTSASCGTGRPRSTSTRSCRAASSCTRRSCGWTLARAHARSGDRIAIAAYLGKSDTFDRAVAEFASAYADQNERDYESLTDAVEPAVTVETGDVRSCGRPGRRRRCTCDDLGFKVGGRGRGRPPGPSAEAGPPQSRGQERW